MNYMNEPTSPECPALARFYGSVTVGERGQVVIPAEARGELGFEPGDKLLALRHPVYKGIVFFKLSQVQSFMDEMQNTLKNLESLEDAP